MTARNQNRSTSTARCRTSPRRLGARRANHTRRAAGRGRRDNADVASPADREGDVVRPVGRVLRMRAGVSDRRGPNRRGCRRRRPRHRRRSRCRPWSSRTATRARRTSALGTTGACRARTGGGLTAGTLAPAAAGATAPGTATAGAAGVGARGAATTGATTRAAVALRALLHRRGQHDRVGEGALAGGQLPQQRVVGVQTGRGRRDTGLAGEVPDVADLVVGHQRDDRARGAGARGAAGAVQVGLVLDRRVGVDDQADVVDVDATSGDVRGDQSLRGAAGERRHVAVTGVLRQVAVQLDRGHAEGVELLGELLGAVLGPGEDHGAPGRSGQVDQDRQAVVGLHVQDVVSHRRDRRLGRVGAVGDRVGQEALDDDVDTGIQGGREQQPLAVARGHVHQPPHAGQEAHVGHVVGLVEHGDLDRVQAGVPALDVVGQPAGAGDEDVDAGAQPADLRVGAHAAEDGEGLHVQRLGQRSHGRIDLGGQLAGRHEDQRARLARLARLLAGRETGQQRQQEGVGLARPGAAAAQDVAPGEGVRQRRGLDREGGGDAVGIEDGGQRGGHAEAGESRVSRHRWLLQKVTGSFCPAQTQRCVSGA